MIRVNVPAALLIFETSNLKLSFVPLTKLPLAFWVSTKSVPSVPAELLKSAPLPNPR